MARLQAARPKVRKNDYVDGPRKHSLGSARPQCSISGLSTATLGLAMAVYPAARVDVTDQGVVIKPSRPPVAPKLIPGRVTLGSE